MSNFMIPWEKVAFEDGMEKGFAKGIAMGIAEGRAEGRIKGLLQALIDVLYARFAKVPRSCLSSIKKLPDADTLISLLTIAAKAESLDEFRETLKKVQQ